MSTLVPIQKPGGHTPLFPPFTLSACQSFGSATVPPEYLSSSATSGLCTLPSALAWVTGRYSNRLLGFLFQLLSSLHTGAKEIVLEYGPVHVTSFIYCPHIALLRIFLRIPVAPRKKSKALLLWPPRPRMAGPAHTSSQTMSHSPCAHVTLTSVSFQNVLCPFLPQKLT